MSPLFHGGLLLVLLWVKDPHWGREVTFSVAVQFYRFCTHSSSLVSYVSKNCSFHIWIHACPKESLVFGQKIHAHTLITLQSVLWLCSFEERGNPDPLILCLKTFLSAIPKCVRERDHSFMLQKCEDLYLREISLIDRPPQHRSDRRFQI